jgi:hypothetical protein
MPATSRSPDADLEELRALNARFIHNFVTHDVESHDAILHPLFVGVMPYGRHDRATFLAMWPHAFNAAETPYYDHRDEQITLVGDVAMVRAANKRTFPPELNRAPEITTYTDTYVYERGRWLCLHKAHTRRRIPARPIRGREQTH